MANYQLVTTYDELIEALRLKVFRTNDKIYAHIATFMPSNMKHCSNNIMHHLYDNNSDGNFLNGSPYNIHAEMASWNRIKTSCITRQKYWTKKIKVDLFVIRFTKSGLLAMSKPCPYCVKFISNDPNIEVNNVYFSTADRTLVKMKFNDLIEEYKHDDSFHKRKIEKAREINKCKKK